ncbi:MAG: S8 family peptidase, partial [Planctomycetota bacterium]
GNTVTGGMSGEGGKSPWWRMPHWSYVIPSYGAGVFCAGDSSPTFAGCDLIGNYGAEVFPVLGPNDPNDPNDPNFVDPNVAAYRLSPYISYGGGICYTGAGSMLIADCNFRENYATIGGGLYWNEANSVITSSEFSENSAFKGGGMYFVDSLTSTITACTLTENRAYEIGGEVVGQGGGEGGAIFASSVPALISDCQIRYNRADVSGGGVYLTGGSLGSTMLRNCLLVGNAAGRDGAGVSCSLYAEAILSNCTVTENALTRLPSYGAGVYCSSNSNVEIIDSIIWANRSSDGAQVAVAGGGISQPLPSMVSISNSSIGPPYDPNQLPGLDSAQSSTGMGPEQGSPYSVLVDGQTIYDRFSAGQERVKVIVSLVDPVEVRRVTDWKLSDSVSLLRAEIADRQSSVLSSLTPDEFILRHHFENLAGFSGEITIEGLNKLLDDPSVVHIEPVRTLYPSLAQGIPLMNATEARLSHNGEGMAIAICDTGVDYTHTMLGAGGFPNSKVIGGYDFGDDDPDPIPSPNTIDPNVPSAAHGTACAGIAAGDLGTVGDYIGGVAHNAKIYALKMTSDDDPNQEAFTDDMISAWDWCVTHQNDDPENPILVTSTSFGGGRFFTTDAADNYSPAMKAAADNALAVGITVLASSGNESYVDSLAWPAAISTVVSVGAVYDTTDEVTGYSNTADFLDILAPSHFCYTTDMVGPGGYNTAVDGDYVDGSATSIIGYFGGTSAACPYAAGAVACLQSAALDILGTYLSPIEVRQLLAETGHLITDAKVDITKPRVDLGAAILALVYGPPVYVEKGCILND